MTESTPTPPLLDIRELAVEYAIRDGAVRAVDGVSFSIAPGEVYGLAGESGCGKSTIAHSILRVLRPPAVIVGGEIRFGDDDVLDMDDETLQAFRWRGASMVFQSALNSLNPVMRVSEQICDVLIRHKKLSKADARIRAADLFETVGISRDRLDAYPHELSGGMRQRVVIAIALALNPSLLIMDEPTTALDVVVQKDILQQIAALQSVLGFSVLFITHDLSLMVEFSQRIGIMYAGKLVEQAPAREILGGGLHPYTKGLVTSFPSITGPKVRLTGIPGTPPNLANPPAGCRFQPRCPVAVPACASIEPPLVDVSPGHRVACHVVTGSAGGVE
jgi:peptide/nickel transport system ATP-binding protein